MSKIYENGFKELKAKSEENDRMYDKLAETRNRVLDNIRSRHNELKELCLEIEEKNTGREEKMNNLHTEIDALLEDLMK